MGAAHCPHLMEPMVGMHSFAECDSGFPFSLGPSQYRDGEGNGTPLQYSCLENPMDGGAW